MHEWLLQDEQLLWDDDLIPSLWALKLEISLLQSFAPQPAQEIGWSAWAKDLSDSNLV